MHAHQDFAFLWNRPFDLSDFEYVGRTISVANERFHSSLPRLSPAQRTPQARFS